MHVVHVVGEMSGKTMPGDIGTAAGAFPEMKRLVEPQMDLPCRTKRFHVLQQLFGDFGQAGMQRANLSAFQGGAVFGAKFS